MDPIFEAYIIEAKGVEVFRIEHIKNKTGPYQTKLKDGSRFDLADTFPINLKYNPPPIKDNSLKDAANKTGMDISKWIREGVFCFNSEFQMKRWFTSKAIKWMVDEKEFQVVRKVVPADKVICGEFQCVVNKTAWNKASSKIIKI
jgi:hypothetical protein